MKIPNFKKNKPKCYWFFFLRKKKLRSKKLSGLKKSKNKKIMTRVQIDIVEDDIIHTHLFSIKSIWI